jgi:hypothetical protein
MRHDCTPITDMLEAIGRQALRDLPHNLAAVQATMRDHGLTRLDLGVTGGEGSGSVVPVDALCPEGSVSIQGILVGSCRSWGAMISTDTHPLLTVEKVNLSLAEACEDLGDDILRSQCPAWRNGPAVEGTIRIPDQGEPVVELAPAPELAGLGF